MRMHTQPWLQKIPNEIGWYLAGFADGEGSFNVSIKKADEHILGWKLTLSFNVSQKDPTVLALYKRHLGCGTIRYRKDGIGYFEVTGITALNERVTPFFRKYHFLSATKKHNFVIFQKILAEVNQPSHLSKEGFTSILQLREQLNVGRGRKRKYSVTNVIIT